MLIDDAGSPFSSSRVLDITSSPQKFTGSIDALDPYNLYRFTLNSRSSFHMSLGGMSANADALLISDRGQILGSSTNISTNDETIDQVLDAGSYYIHDLASTAYNLSVSATPSSNAHYHPSGSTDSDILTNASQKPTLDLNNSASNQKDLTSTLDDFLNDPIINPLPSSLPDATNPIFTSFSVIDASGDNTPDTVFEGGAIRFSYEIDEAASLSEVQLEVVQLDSIVSYLGTWKTNKLSNTLINLADFSITGGDYLVRAIANTSDGKKVFSSFHPLQILPWNKTQGTFAADSLNYYSTPGEGAVFLGGGGTDTLTLSNISQADVTNINGMNLNSFNPSSVSTASQAIFQGTAFDYLTLADGGEIYFQGIENIEFADASHLDLQIRPNDKYFDYQWNLHVSDVAGAWRFTQGTNNVLLASLDTGILTASGASGSIVDIAPERLITDPTDDDNTDDDGDSNNGKTTYGHGHAVISIMSSTANNNLGVAGINWNSKVYVNDVYQGVSLLQAINDTIDYARANNMRIVFQGGIQGDYWLYYSGGTREQLEQLIQNNSDIALFAVGAGNGGPGGNYSDPNYLTSVNGLARLETTHSNVMSVGALETKADVNGELQWQIERVNNLLNAKSANIASYSNRGDNLTIMAATDSPAIDKYGNMIYFRGTSAANPNLAGIASLVWSVNPNLNAGQVRQILTDTAMDLGAKGRDNTFGYGLVNADAAVRRAWALQNNSDLANLYPSSSLLV